MLVPVIQDVPLICINQAALHYRVPATLIIAVLKTEGGRAGMAHKNRNGTLDYGSMQINSIWKTQINKAGYTMAEIQYNPCINVSFGTWLLSQQIVNGSGLWQGIGDYHSYTSGENIKYARKISRIYYALNKYIQS